MVIFHSYVSLPEGTKDHYTKLPKMMVKLPMKWWFFLGPNAKMTRSTWLCSSAQGLKAGERQDSDRLDVWVEVFATYTYNYIQIPSYILNFENSLCARCAQVTFCFCAQRDLATAGTFALRERDLPGCEASIGNCTMAGFPSMGWP